MTVVRGSQAYGGGGSVVTIGNFDGVHLGHQALLAAARALGAGAPVCAFTFDPAPRDVLRPDNGIARIQRLDDRVDALLRHGADEVLVEPFDHELAARSPEWFASEVLTARLRASAVVVGHDFRFGRGRSGDADGLRALLACPVIRVEPITVDGEVVSSSRIREAVGAGDVRTATRLLGRPHEVSGEVVRGDGRGAGLGFPTANVRTEDAGPGHLLLPAHGVYAVWASPGDGRTLPAVANLGVRPTFGGTRPQLEVHLLDVREDLYGRVLRVAFVERVRGEQRFSGRDALMERIAVDIAEAREALATGHRASGPP